MYRGVFLAVVALFCLLTERALAVCNPSFPSTELTLPVPAAQSFTIDLRTLLDSPQVGEKLDWDTFGQPAIPSWVTLDKASEKLVVNAPLSAVGQAKFNLGVQCTGGEQGDNTLIILQVQVVPKWKNAPNELFLGDIPEGKLFKLDLRQHVTTADNNQSLTFLATGLQQNAPWLKLQANGMLEGTPEAAHQGAFRGISFKAIHPSGGSASTFANGNVVRNVTPPKWKSNPVLLPPAPIGHKYEQDLRPHVEHTENAPLKFQKTSGPNWVSIDPNNGLLSGSPTASEAGPVSVGARAYFIDSGVTYEATTTLSFSVEDVNGPPVWVRDPLELPDARTGVLYTQDLRNSVTDPNGDTLRFRIVDGPGWAELSQDGVFRGTPKSSDAGTAEFVAEATDGEFPVRAKVVVRVVKANEPPKWKANPTVLPNAKEDVPYVRSLLSYVEDTDGDKLSFTVLSVTGRNWLTVSLEGEMRGTPGKADIGDHVYRIRVTDGQPGHAAVADVKITVDHVNHAPFWNLNPINLNAQEDIAYEQDVSRFAGDRDDDEVLTFSKVSGDGWLSVTPQGLLKGTPSKPHLGSNEFKIKVTDKAGASAETRVVIAVSPTNHAPKWKHSPVVLPNAKQDSLYSESLKDFVEDSDEGDELTFAFVSGRPDWLNLTTEGILNGIPRQKDIGTHTMKVRVLDKGSLFADGTVTVTVIKVNKPPRWTQPLVDMGQTPEKSPFQFDLARFAEDPDGDPLSFSMREGPGWLNVDRNGLAAGTPGAKDVGSFTTVFEVSDGQFTVEVNGKIRVLNVNEAPEFQQNPIKILAKSRETLVEELNQAKYVIDPDGGTLIFSLKDEREWLTVSTTGRLTAIPKAQHIGVHTLGLTVSDGEFTATGSLEVTVDANPEPPIWLEDPIRLEAAIGKPLTGKSLAPFAKDKDNLPLTFSGVGATTWLTVSQNGDLSGTPATSHIGENRFTVRVSNGVASADAVLILTVSESNQHAPFWLEDPITLANAAIGVSYRQSVAHLAKDLDGDQLTFSKAGGAEWATVTEAGEIVGIPQNQHQGPNSVVVRVADPGNLAATATARITVGAGGGNQPPQWTQNPLQLGNASVGTTYGKDLKPFVTDPNGDQLTFSAIQAPVWLTLRADGMLTGVPGAGHVGQFTARFRVSDGQFFADVDASGQVAAIGNQPPIWKLESLNFIVKAGEPFTVASVVAAGYVRDPENDPMTFRVNMTPPPDWVTLTSAGALTISPRNEHVGDHLFSVRATDSFQNSSDATMTIRVLPNQDLKPPIWLQDPIAIDATVGQALAINISDKARDPNVPPLPLSFAKDGAAGWITMSSSGTLSGSPSAAQVGEHRFQATVTNSVGSATATVIVTVRGGAPHNDDFVIDRPVANAPAEILWVVDNSWVWWWLFKDKLTVDLERSIAIFHQELQAAQVRHTSVFLSTDAHGRQGQPVPDDNNRLVLRWDDPNWVRSFAGFVDNIRVNKCYNSPLWSMFLFYEAVPSIWELYHNGYMEPGVAMDAMIVTKQLDQYKRYTQNKPQATWGAIEFADHFIDFHRREQKSFRTSAIAATCPQLLDPWEQPTMVGPANTYQEVTIRTGGDYYAWSCQSGMEEFLRDFAQKVIRRAYIHANRRFRLTQKPLDPTKIVVKLNGRVLNGNQNEPQDQWRYDPVRQEILVFWHLIDLNGVPPGARLTIEYPARETSPPRMVAEAAGIR